MGKLSKEISSTNALPMNSFGYLNDSISAILYDGTEYSREKIASTLNVFWAYKSVLKTIEVLVDDDGSFIVTNGDRGTKVAKGDVVICYFDGHNDCGFDISPDFVAVEPLEVFKKRPIDGKWAAADGDESFQSVYRKTIKAVLDMSNEYISGIDRNPLGIFASDPGEFLRAVAILVFNQTFDIADRKDNTLYKLVREHFNMRNDTLNDDVLTKAMAEALFWFSISGDADLEDIYAFNTRGDRTDIAMKMSHRDFSFIGSKASRVLRDVEKAFQVPAYIPYLVAGVTDHSVIEECVKNNIDVDMAVELEKVDRARYAPVSFA